MAWIPTGLSLAESQVYQKLIRVAKERHARGQAPRPVVVITDVGKDYDDLSALIVLREFHRLGLIQLRAVVANLMPADKRARLARAALDSLGLRDVTVPVARGTRGSSDEHEELAHEFSGGEFVATPDFSSSQLDGQDLLHRVYRTAKMEGEKLYLLCLSSLQDIHKFADKHPELVVENTAEVHMQGGNYFTREGKLEPDCKAANNRFHLDAAKAWHSFIQTNAIPSYTYTKTAAFAAPLSSDVFKELEATGHSIGAYLRRVQVEQDVAFYKRACESDPQKRFAPFMDQEWFLANKTNWQLEQREGERLPTDKAIVPYLTKLVLYDAHAALGVAGEDVVAKLNVLQGKHRWHIQVNKEGCEVGINHRISCDGQSTMVPEQIEGVAVALSALMKGSLISANRCRASAACYRPCIPRSRANLFCPVKGRVIVFDRHESSIDITQRPCLKRRILMGKFEGISWPKLVVAIRGTIVTKKDDLTDYCKILFKKLHDSEDSYNIVITVLWAINCTQKYLISGDEVIAGHSLGAVLGLLAPRQLAIDNNLVLQAHLFNPPNFSLDVMLKKGEIGLANGLSKAFAVISSSLEEVTRRSGAAVASAGSGLPDVVRTLVSSRRVNDDTKKMEAESQLLQRNRSYRQQQVERQLPYPVVNATR